MTEIVKLNVGGIPYATSMSTLTQHRDSMLRAMVEQEYEQNLIKEGKELFIDRNGPIFKYVLEFLRNADYVILPEDVSTLRELHLEAEFYLLGDLVALISKKLNDDGKPKWKVGDIITRRDLASWKTSWEPASICSFLASGRLIGSLAGTILEINAKYVVVKFTGSFFPKANPVMDLEKYCELSAICDFERDLLLDKPMPSN